ncbi:MAG TPA: hypothetical protein VGZ23_02910 [bacterium]|nr:hypothetical protein [bacterium]
MTVVDRPHGFVLALTGFLVLFLELACIRWFAAEVIFLQFFTNVVLIASFLGMSCGCLAAGRREYWLARLPLLALWTFLAAFGALVLYLRWQGLVIDVGHQASPQEVFFGTEYRNPDVARFVVPIDVVTDLFFVLVAFVFVGLGQVLGRAFNGYPDRVRGYALNIGGSLAGIAAFSALSFAQAPAPAWFLIAFAGIAYLLHLDGELTWVRAAALGLSTVVIAMSFSLGPPTRWSPYYAVSYNEGDRNLTVNTIAHQVIVPFATPGLGAAYSLIHLLNQRSGGPPFQDVLIIGAGTGNDVAHALRLAAGRIDAVEIDPVILDIGIHHHPDRPYQDPRVVRHLDDGRHFLRTTSRRYDLVVYGLVDSLILHSSYANLRLESYLFTDQAFADVRRVLKPGGVFVMYNYFRQGWVVQRVDAMAEAAFGRPPVVLSLPYRPTLRANDPPGFTLVAVGHTQGMAEAFRRHGVFWLNLAAPTRVDTDGFTPPPGAATAAAQWQWAQIAPTRLINDARPVPRATDDWPFLYLRQRLIPAITARSVVGMGLLGLAMVYGFLPRESAGARIDPRMFFLGAGFMLLETKAVVQLALLFGSTWVVNSMVFATILLLILLANLYVLKVPNVRLVWHYTGLFLLLAAGVLAPLEIFLGGGVVGRYVVPSALVLGPMFFAGVIFARLFRQSRHPDLSLGSNVAGAVVGGLAESFSLLLGFRLLVLVAMSFYALSAWRSGGRA